MQKNTRTNLRSFSGKTNGCLLLVRSSILLRRTILLALFLVVSCVSTPTSNLTELQEVNSLVNAYVVYKRDLEGNDYWQTPDETLLRGTGDCEDYAILKAHYLAKYNPRLVAVQVRSSGEYHALLRVEGYYLDNRLPEILTEEQMAKEYHFYVAFPEGKFTKPL